VDAHLVEQARLQQLPSDIRAQHQDVLVPRGLLGSPDRCLQPIEGEPPAVVAEEILPGPVGDNEARDAGPRCAAPRAHADIERAPSDDGGSDTRVYFPVHAEVDLAVRSFPAIHACSRSPPSPIALPPGRSGRP
jgi:hypothetical protein